MTLNELYALAEADGIPVYAFPCSAPAMSIQLDGTCAIAIDPLQLESEAEERVRLAHELGHCETWAFYDRSCPLQTIRRMEYRAEKWAVTHLLTRSDFQRAFDAGYREIWELADYFNLPESTVRKAANYYDIP